MLPWRSSVFRCCKSSKTLLLMRFMLHWLRSKLASSARSVKSGSCKKGKLFLDRISSLRSCRPWKEEILWTGSHMRFTFKSVSWRLSVSSEINLWLSSPGRTKLSGTFTPWRISNFRDSKPPPNDNCKTFVPERSSDSNVWQSINDLFRYSEVPRCSSDLILSNLSCSSMKTYLCSGHDLLSNKVQL